MRILFCDYEYPPLGGGGGALNAWLAEELAKKHSVTVLTSGADELAADETINGVRVIRVPVYFRSRLQTANFPSMIVYLLNGWRIGRKLLREEKFDIINTFFVVPTGPVGHALARFAKIPNILSVLGGDIYDPSKRSSPHRHAPLRAAVRYLLKQSERVVGESHDVLENVRKYYLRDLETDLIPLGIPRPPKVEMARESLGLSPDDFVLITVGRLVPRKAVNQLLEVVSNIKDRKPKLIVIGGGPEEEDLQKQSKELQLEEQIVFAGHVSDSEKIGMLQLSDAYVSTSQHEGFGLVFLEGMAAGLPVVCYDHGGQTDFVHDGENGFLVKLNDQEKFQSRIEQLCVDRELYNKMSANNLSVIENYYIDKCAADYEQLFQQHIDQHTASK
ncbi:MAG: glycosyltransferase family 4 protein [Pseudomonadota bacterium]